MPVLFGRGLVFTDEVIEEEKVEVVGWVEANIFFKEIDECADEVVVVELDGLEVSMGGEGAVLEEKIVKGI